MALASRARRSASPLTVIAGLVVLALVPSLIGGGSYTIVKLTPVLILATVAVSANLAWGYTGIFTLGHAIFFGVGAYTVGLMSTKQHTTALPALLIAAAATGLLLGIMLGLFLFTGSRVGGLYVGLVTLALSYVGEQVANGWARIGAANGIPALPLPTIGSMTIGSTVDFYYLSVTLLAVCLLVLAVITHTQFGLVMKAVRDDEERAEFFGYRRGAVQITVFAISGAMAAIAGGLYGLEEGFVSSTMLGVVMSTQIILWVVLGGRGTFIGPLIGVALLQLGGESLRNRYPTFWPVLLGALLLITIMYLPNGLWGGVLQLRNAVAKQLAEANSANRRRGTPDHLTPALTPKRTD